MTKKQLFKPSFGALLSGLMLEVPGRLALSQSLPKSDLHFPAALNNVLVLRLFLIYKGYLFVAETNFKY